MACAKRVVWYASASAAMAVFAGVARAEYGVVDLGPFNSVGGINLTGQVALTNAQTGMPKSALLYSGGSFINVGTLGGTDSSAHGINAAGQVVGNSTTSGGVMHAFLWTPGGTGGVSSNPQMTDLNANGAASEADAINSSGQIVGFMSVTQPGQLAADTAFIYSNGTLRQLPLPPGAFESSYAYSINDAGNVTGAAYTPGGALGHGFFYDGTRSVDLGDLGGANTSPSAINKGNRIVGFSTTATGFDHAFLYANGAINDLGTLGGDYSYAVGINSNNQIVGGSYTDAADSIYHAFVSDGTQMTDLNSLITSRAANWTLSEADAINDNGIIAGTGTLSGVQHAFMLKQLLSGDVNGDGKVDFTDLLALAQHYGQSGAGWEQGDFNGDASVTFNDLLALAQNYGKDIGLSSAAASAVPEPGGLMMITGGLFCAVRRRR